MTYDNQKIAAPEAEHVRRMVVRIRRMLSATPAGIPRGELRNRLNSREKHLFDKAIGLLIAVGDVSAEPAAQGGTRYRLTEQAAVARTSDSETKTSSTNTTA